MNYISNFSSKYIKERFEESFYFDQPEHMFFDRKWKIIVLNIKYPFFNPLYTDGLFLLVWYNRLGIVHCIYLGVSGYNLKIYHILSEDRFTFIV